MKTINLILFLLLASIAQAQPMRLADQPVQTQQQVEQPKANVNWMTIEEAYKRTQQEPRKIFIDMYTDWCGWCKRMDASTFSHPVIAEILNTKFYPVKFNAESKLPVTLGDKTYLNENPQGRTTHQLAINMMDGRLSYPTTVYLLENFEKLTIIPGYKGPKEMEQILTFLYTNAWNNNQTFDQFVQTFNGKIQ